MRFFWSFVAFFALTVGVSAQVAGSPVILPPDSPALHVTQKFAPVYPPIARAAQISGTVVLDVKIDATGHVVDASPISGSAMLQGAARDAVEKWVYAPVIVEGTPTVVSTTVPINFALAASVNKNDEAIARDFFPVQQACLRDFRAHADPAETSAACLKAAQIADTFSTEERFIERRSAYVYAAGALRRNQQFTESLEYANKAVAVVQKGHDDNSGASAAYMVRGQSEGALQNLSAALADLEKAEGFERKAIERMMPDAPALVKAEYLPALRNILMFESQILRAQGDANAADKKVAEANKL